MSISNDVHKLEHHACSLSFFALGQSATVYTRMHMWQSHVENEHYSVFNWLYPISSPTTMP